MSDKVNFFLEKTLGKDFFETLSKVELWKPGTKSTIDHEELRTALQIVPRTIIALLIREFIPMKIGDTKEIPIFVGKSAMVRATKHERDVYSGEVEEDNKKVVEFKLRSLPGVGLVIMSAFELYDMQNLINSDQYVQNPSPSVPPLEPTDIKKPSLEISSLIEDADQKIQKLIDERLALHDLINRVIENKLSQKDAVHQMMLSKLSKELEQQKKMNELFKLKTPDAISELAAVAKKTADPKNEYLVGLANGVEVANAVVNQKEPNFMNVEKPLIHKPIEINVADIKPTPKLKKNRPLQKFLDERKKKKPKEFSVEMAKGEQVTCPDCGNNIFNGQFFSACICYGDSGKVFLKKTENGFKIRFSKNWEVDNIEMLLEVLRKKK